MRKAVLVAITNCEDCKKLYGKCKVNNINDLLCPLSNEFLIDKDTSYNNVVFIKIENIILRVKE